MARICVGCGLESVDGELTIATGGAAWPYACNQSNGGNLYCDPAAGPNGRLHGPPNPRSVLFGTAASSLTPGLAIPNSGDDIPLATPSVNIVNPSACLSANAFSTWTFDNDITLPVGSRVRLSGDGNELYDFTNTGNSTITSLGWELGFSYSTVIAAGAVVPTSFVVSIRATGTAGVEVNRTQWRVRGIVVTDTP